jgi:hypothetical protein
VVRRLGATISASVAFAPVTTEFTRSLVTPFTTSSTLVLRRPQVILLAADTLTAPTKDPVCTAPSRARVKPGMVDRLRRLNAALGVAGAERRAPIHAGYRQALLAA